MDFEFSSSNRGYKHFSYNFLPSHNRELKSFNNSQQSERTRADESKSKKQRDFNFFFVVLTGDSIQRESLSQADGSKERSHNEIKVEPREKTEKQQKPLTLYGIGLINQIMDFTWLFLLRLRSFSTLHTFPFSSSSSSLCSFSDVVATQLNRLKTNQNIQSFRLQFFVLLSSSFSFPNSSSSR
jgi:hypothetical protein